MQFLQNHAKLNDFKINNILCCIFTKFDDHCFLPFEPSFG
jgi:hypothetical protein